MNNKSSIVSAVALVVGLVSLVLGGLALHGSSTLSQAQPASQSVGGVYEVNNVAPQFSAGADFGTLPVNINWVGGKILAGSNVGYYRNLSGTVQYAENAEVSTDGTASSSYKIYVYATTTAPTTLYDFTVVPQNANNISSTTLLINGFALATSSTATTTSSDDTKANSGPAAGSVALVPNNGYVIVRIVATNGAACTVVGVCPSATSTQRGFNVPWRLFVHN